MRDNKRNDITINSKGLTVNMYNTNKRTEDFIRIGNRNIIGSCIHYTNHVKGNIFMSSRSIYHEMQM